MTQRLALRKDKRAISSIIEDLQKPFYGSWLIAAICEMPDCRYLPYFEDFIDSLDKKDKIALDDNIREAKEALMLVARG